MSSDILDMAIVCVDAAEEFVKNVEGFEIYSPCVQNSDLFVLQGGNPKKIGITQNRKYQGKLVKDYFGEDVKIVPMIHQALPYSLEKGQLDGIVIDVTKAIHLKGDKYPTMMGDDYTTYVLIVNQEFKKTKAFKDFIRLYNQSVQKLNGDEKKLKKHFQYYTKSVSQEGGLEKWKIKLLSIVEN
ncbi:ABC transporter substrate-binding (seleno)protein SaoB [Clostridiaceae bacterium 35-E11]